MYQQYEAAGKGLKKVFIGEVLCLLSFIPVVGAVLSVVGLVLTLVGLHSAGSTHPGFKTAFTVSIISLILGVIAIFASFLNIVTTILSLVEVYLVCNAAGELLREKGDAYQADKGVRVWKMYMVCTVVTVVCLLLSLIPVLGIIAAVVALIASIVLVVAGILYLIFLYRAQESLMS